jgi:hypothetical protein
LWEVFLVTTDIFPLIVHVVDFSAHLSSICTQFTLHDTVVHM